MPASLLCHATCEALREEHDLQVGVSDTFVDLQDLPDGVVYLQSRSPGLSKLMPLYTAYELLIMPLTCFGLGMYLKQGIILCPFQTVLSMHCYHLIDFDLLQRMTLFHAHYGFFQHDGQQTVFSVCAAAAHHDLVSASETADVSAQSAIAR